MLSRFLALALLGLGAAAVQGAAPDDTEKEVAPIQRIRQLRLRLDRKVSMEKEIAANTSLKDAIAQLEKEFKIKIVVDAKAFDSIGVQKVEQQPVQLDKMSNVPLGVIVSRLLVQIKGDLYHGSYLLRDGHIEATTEYHRRAEVFKDRANPNVYPSELRGGVGGRIYTPVYGMVFDKKPLDDALGEIAESSGITIVVDVRLGEKARAPVSGRMNNMMVDTVVRLLTNMAGLKTVVLDGAIYVTSEENAKSFEEELRKMMRGGDDGGDDVPAPAGVVPGPAAMVVPAPPAQVAPPMPPMPPNAPPPPAPKPER